MYHAWKDDASDHDISVAAKSILDTCVLRDATKKVGNMPIGGIRGYVGQYYDYLTHYYEKILPTSIPPYV